MVIIRTTDNTKSAEIGRSDFWRTLYSTAKVHLDTKKDILLALDFLEKRKCTSEAAMEVARQMNLIRDEFSKLKPEQVVYDFENQGQIVPWANNISPVVTSCGNYFITSDGKDLFHEIICILVYASVKKVSVIVQ